MLAKAAGVSLRSVQRILEARDWRRVHVARSSCRWTRSSLRSSKTSLASTLILPPMQLFSTSTRKAMSMNKPARYRDEARPRRDDDARLQTSRHHYAVRSSQHPRWHRHRPQHAAPSPPRVHPFPLKDEALARLFTAVTWCSWSSV